MRRLLAAIALGLALASAVAGASVAEERVGVRGEANSGRVRLVFDWELPVTYAAEIFDGMLLVRFARPFEANLDAAVRALSPYLGAGAIRPDGRTAAFALKRPLTFRSGPPGREIVIELLDPPGAKKPAAKAAAPQAPHPAQEAPAAAGKAEAAPAPAAVAKAAPPAGAPAAPIDSHQPRIAARVELGLSKDGTRLEIDFGRPVQARTRENGRNVVVTFDTPGELELGDLRDRDLNLIEGIEAGTERGGPMLSLTLAERAQLKRSRNGNRLIFDIAPGAQRPAAQQQAAQPPAAPPAKKAEPPQPLLPAKAAASDPAAKPGSPAADAKEPEAAPPQAPTPLAAAGGKALTVATRIGDDNVVLRFPWSEPVAAAAFRRGQQVWIVFDRFAQLDLAALRVVPTHLLTGAVQGGETAATALRLYLPTTINPTLSRDGNSWSVALRAQALKPETAIEVAPRRADNGVAELVLAVDQPGSVVSMRDPDVGDRLLVVPVPKPGLGVAGTREFAEFRLLDSAQGVAVEPVAERVTVDTTAEAIRVTAPGGLYLSLLNGADSPTAASKGQRVAADARLFDFPSWTGGGIAELNENRRRLNLELANAPADGRNAVRLDMARLYLANMMGNDALGMIERIEADSPDKGFEPEFHALKGAAQVMARRYVEAARTLADPNLAGNKELMLWRAMAARQLGQDAAAQTLFRSSGYVVPNDYPAALQLDMALMAAETALGDSGPGVASTLLDRVADLATEPAQKGEVEYMRGRIAAAQGEKAKALALWKQVVTRREPPSWVRAELDLVKEGLADKSLTREAAVERLERLRYGWRGGVLERQILALLAKLQIDDGRDSAGLTAYRDLVALFPESAEARAAADEMGKAFTRLFVDGAADAMPPLKALALYDSFRELTPAGTKGDELVRKLADRLASIDLLGRAGELLEDLVKRRLTGEPKAETGARLATIRLQNGEPAQALAALDMSQVDGVPETLQQERGRLRARALFAQAKPADALAAIAQDPSEPADRLRQDIYWRQADWANAGKVAVRRAERLAAVRTDAGKADAAGPDAAKPGATDAAGKLSDEAAGAVMSAAVASALANDKAALTGLRQRFAAQMDQTGYKSPFRLIANGSGTTADLTQIARTLEAAQGLQKFLADVKPAAGAPDKPAAKAPAPDAKLN